MVTAKHLPSSGIDDENMCRFSFLVHSVGVFDSRMNHLGNEIASLAMRIFGLYERISLRRCFAFHSSLLMYRALILWRSRCLGYHSRSTDGLASVKFLGLV